MAFGTKILINVKQLIFEINKLKNKSKIKSKNKANFSQD